MTIARRKKGSDWALLAGLIFFSSAGFMVYEKSRIALMSDAEYADWQAHKVHEGKQHALRFAQKDREAAVKRAEFSAYWASWKDWLDAPPSCTYRIVGNELFRC